MSVEQRLAPGDRLGSPKTNSRHDISSVQNLLLLFLGSFLALYFELVVNRYLSTEIRVFAYLKNLTLIASFFGIGFGMLLGSPPKALKRWFPLVAAAIFFLIKFASPLRLTHLPVPGGDYVMPGDFPHPPAGPWLTVWPLLILLIYLIVVPGILYGVVAFFTVLGGIVGERLAGLPPLQGYGVNLAGSLAGILVFTLLSFLGSPPAVWVLLGLVAAIPFFIRDRWAIVIFALIICVMTIPEPRTYWSPYYRITLEDVPPPAGWPNPTIYLVDVNHDYHQKMLDLSPQFMARYPEAEPNHSGLSTYEVPYQLMPHPGRVLIVGAGSGNDVAAALRHGAAHVDAVEIDPTIIKLGRTYHPEHPYDSARVTVSINDARAFFKRTRQKYDLIVFGYLDSHTLLTSMSSIRLDNYVYTLESFREARHLLLPNGTVVLAFSSGHTFLSDRLYATLTEAFGAPPRAYFTGYDSTGVVFVEGGSRESKVNLNFPEMSSQLEARRASSILVTDHWPFLYLRSRTIPVSILSVLVLFLYFAIGLLRRNFSVQQLADRSGLHLFFLGAGFMLLETKGITELSLLFGSTWIVNALVIASFLLMGLLANSLVMFIPISKRLAYCALFILLAASMLFPYSLLDALPRVATAFAAGVLVGLPVFFSGLVFSRSFRDVAHPAQGLGINLLGAVVGGALENFVMIGGTLMLGVLAIALYAISAALLAKSTDGRPHQPAALDG